MEILNPSFERNTTLLNKRAAPNLTPKILCESSLVTRTLVG